MGFSALILTYNEEVNLEGALQSLAGCDDVWVLDSESSDKTLEIAKEHGCQIRVRPFDNYSSQRNFGLALPFKYEWVLMLDADERLSRDLLAEITEVTTKQGSDFALYRMRRKDMFMGKWIRRSSVYPTWFGRLAKVGHVRVEREVNEEFLTDGKVGLLKGHLIHHPFNKGISYWMERHNRYSSMEADLLERKQVGKPSLKNLFSKDPAIRRSTMKTIAYRMPARYLMAFLYLFIFKGGFLDGRAGFHYSLLRMFYEYLIVAKQTELRRRKEGKEL
jgi:glycosyltransferase involved in cell wall biosynthesis